MPPATRRGAEDESSSEARTGEVQNAMAEAARSLKGITRDTATLIASAIYEGGINEPRFLRDIDAADTMEVLQDITGLRGAKGQACFGQDHGECNMRTVPDGIAQIVAAEIGRHLRAHRHFVSCGHLSSEADGKTCDQ